MDQLNESKSFVAYRPLAKVEVSRSKTRDASAATSEPLEERASRCLDEANLAPPRFEM